MIRSPHCGCKVNAAIAYVGGLDHGPLWRDFGANTDSRYRRMIVAFIDEHGQLMAILSTVDSF